MKRRKFILSSALSLPAITMAQKFHSNSHGLKKGFVVKAHENRFNEKTRLFGLNPVDIKVSTKDTDGALSISEYAGSTKGGPPLHIHLHQDEIFIILEGEHLFQLGDEQFHLTAGDTIFIPRNVPHAPCQISDQGRYFFLLHAFRHYGGVFQSPGRIKSDRTSPARNDGETI